MVTIKLGQSGVIRRNAAGENEVYFHANGLPGKFYVLDLETGKVRFSQVIPDSEVMWGMTAGPDNNIYFSGTSDKKLYRYLPIERKIEVLGLNPSDGWVCDLEATSEGKIYGGTYTGDKTGGKLFEYDIAAGTFINYGTMMKGLDYVSGIGSDEKYIYAGMGTRIQLFRIDRETGVRSEIIIPDNPTGLKTGDSGSVSDVLTANHRIFAVLNVKNAVVMDAVTLEVLHTFKCSCRVSAPSPYDGDIVYYEFETKLYQYNTRTNQSAEVKVPSPLPVTIRMKDIQWIEMNSGEKAGRKVLVMVNQYGNCVFYDPTDDWIALNDLDIDTDPVRIQGIKTGFDGRLYFGGYQRGLSIYNPFTNKIDLNIPAFPQPEGIACLNRKFYYGTYTGAVIYRFDPEKPAVPHVNPEKVYTFANRQDRPFAMTAGDDRLFVGTTPDYGMLGGSLAVYDERTNRWSQYDGVVKDQSVHSLVYRNGLLYGSTTIWGGLGIEPSEEQAKMFIWDVEKGVKLEEFKLEIPGIDTAPKLIGDLSFGPDGLLWGIVEGTIFAMDADTRKVLKSRMIFPSLYDTSKWKAYDLEWGQDGMLYTTLGRNIVVIDPETLRHKVIVACSISDMALGLDGSIYYAPESGARLSRIAIPEMDATLSGIYRNGELLENFSPGKLEYSTAIGGDITVTTTQKGAKADVIRQHDFARTVITIQVVSANGKSKLEYSIKIVSK